MIQKSNKTKKQQNTRTKILSAFLFSCFLVFLFFIVAVAASNISASDYWAWNDIIGWIDFCNLSGGVCTSAPGVYSEVNVYGNRLEGYAKSGVGPIALNCKTTPNGDICGVSDFKVRNNGAGSLSGFAWNDNIGWVSFWCGDDFDPVVPGVQDTCTTANYRVTIDANGDFSGFAWNETAGWISFNCANDFDSAMPGVQGKCVGDPGGTSNYKINTSWRIGPAFSGDLVSSVFDTGVAGGAALNTLLWQGTRPAGTNVRFQIASSNCSNGATDYPACAIGSWSFIGPNNSAIDYYAPAGPDSPLALDSDNHNNKRYFRYKVFLESDAGGTAAPSIDDIIINWSP